jgi:hypothetical protein
MLSFDGENGRNVLLKRRARLEEEAVKVHGILSGRQEELSSIMAQLASV